MSSESCMLTVQCLCFFFLKAIVVDQAFSYQFTYQCSSLSHHNHTFFLHCYVFFCHYLEPFTDILFLIKSLHFKLPPAIVFVSSCPASESHMFQSRYRETIVQILIHCFCCGSSCFLYFYIQFLTDSDVFFNVVVWTDIFLVFLFFFQKIENGRFASYRYFAHAKVNESDFLMITKR